MTDFDSGYVRKSDRKAQNEGFKRNEVDWTTVINSAKQNFPNKIQLVQDQRDGSKYVSKIGKEKLRTPIPIDSLGSGASGKHEKRLLDLYRNANRTYMPPLKQDQQQQQQQNYQQQSNPGQQLMYSQAPNQPPVNGQNFMYQQQQPQQGYPQQNYSNSADYPLQHERERHADLASRIREKLMNPGQNDYEKGGFDPATKTWYQPRPRPENMPPFMSSAKANPHSNRYSPY
jgi:hypothetical protein